MVDFNDGMGSGDESADVSETKIEAAVLSHLDLDTSVGLGTETQYSALTKPGYDSKKQTWGRMKEPVAAKFVVYNMDTGNEVAKSNKFLLTGVVRETREKFQVLYGFDEQWMLSSFGRDVPMYSISGVLMNLRDDQDWVRNFHLFYENHMRASILTKNKRQVCLFYSNRMIRGYPIAKTEQDDSNNETMVQFNMNILVRQDKMLG